MVIWKMDFTGGKANAEKVYNELQMIEDRTPENIVNYARNENTELHKCFEWDDRKAAENYRKQQARVIVCNLIYSEVKEETKELVQFRLMQSVNEKYEPVKLIIQDKEEYQRLLERAKSELRAFKERYKNLVELQEIFSLID